MTELPKYGRLQIDTHMECQDFAFLKVCTETNKKTTFINKKLVDQIILPFYQIIFPFYSDTYLKFHTPTDMLLLIRWNFFSIFSNFCGHICDIPFAYK